MIIAVDFDGTIHNGTYPDIGFVFANCREVISRLRQEGHYIIIWTCREGEELLDAINFLLEQNIEFDRVNDNKPSLCEAYNNNSRKVSADVYVDDKNVGGLRDWLKIEDYILNIS